MADLHTELSIVDVHSHLVPGVDDGTDTVEESLEALSELFSEGVRTVVTTPHLVLPNLRDEEAIDRELERHRRSFDDLAAACLKGQDLPTVALGQEIWAPDGAAIRRVAERTDVGLGGGRYLLVEFGFRLQGNHNDVVREVQAAGRQIVIAHPERYHFLPDHLPLDVMRVWQELGALLQVNVGSLTGHYRRSSPASESLAWQMVEAGLIDLLSSDHHGTRRDGVSPREALDALTARDQLSLAHRAMMDIPGSIARNETIDSRLPR